MPAVLGLLKAETNAAIADRLAASTERYAQSALMHHGASPLRQGVTLASAPCISRQGN